MNGIDALMLGSLLFITLICIVIYQRWRKVTVQNLALARTAAEQLGTLEEVRRELEELTLVDPLTRLRNRRYLREMIDGEISRVLRLHSDHLRKPGPVPGDRSYLGFILIDVDHFRAVNEDHGHDVGDAALKWIAAQLHQVVRDMDEVIRWSGEEFLVLCKDVNPAGAHELARRLAAHVEERPFMPGGTREIRLTLSIGFSLYPFVGSIVNLFNYEEVIGFAGRALDIARHNGRAMAVGIIGEDGAISASDKPRLRKDIGGGVRGGQLRLLAPDDLSLS